MHRKVFVFIAAFLFAAVLINIPPQPALAAVPEVRNAFKTTYGHESTVLDKSFYADASAYDNPSVNEQVMKIGLDFGSEAVGWLSLENVSGGGFVLGYYDENRVFHAQRQTKAHFIYVNITEKEGDMTPEGRPEILYSFQIVNGLDSAVLFSFDETVTRIALISSDGSQIRYKDDSFHGGFECTLSEGLISVVNYVGLEDYVKGVIPYEMSSYWPFEALRAQAVCARTYAIYNVDAYADKGFDLTDDTRSQVYRGTVDSDEVTDEAVDSTAGQIVRYRGEPCEVYYFSSDGGATEDGANVFSADRPYLAGKTDPFEKAVDYTLSYWEFAKSGEEIADILRNAGHSIGAVTEIRPHKSHSGNVVALSFCDDESSVTVEGRRCYTMLGLHSCNFDVLENEGSFSFIGSGWGHNCGMSQWGAYAMADNYGYNYDDIIRFYFTGAYVA